MLGNINGYRIYRVRIVSMFLRFFIGHPTNTVEITSRSYRVFKVVVIIPCSTFQFLFLSLRIADSESNRLANGG